MIARAVRLAEATSSATSLVVLVAFNLVPLAGVLLGRWSVQTLLVLYWIENGIVGLLNVPKILLAEGSPPPGQSLASIVTAAVSRAGVAFFFLVHYGIFWVVHGVFVMTLPMLAGVVSAASAPLDPGRLSIDPSLPVLRQIPPAAVIDWSAVTWGAIGLAISHGFSFAVNFLGRHEYRKVSPTEQMGRPYGRVVLLHLAILFGGFLSLAIGSPIGALLVLVALKTIIDVALHRREHEGLAARSVPSS